MWKCPGPRLFSCADPLNNLSPTGSDRGMGRLLVVNQLYANVSYRLYTTEFLGIGCILCISALFIGYLKIKMLVSIPAIRRHPKIGYVACLFRDDKDPVLSPASASATIPPSKVCSCLNVPMSFMYPEFPQTLLNLVKMFEVGQTALDGQSLLSFRDFDVALSGSHTFSNGPFPHGESRAASDSLDRY